MTTSHSTPSDESAAQGDDRPLSRGLHPAIYIALGVLVLWIIVAVGASFFELAPDGLPFGIIAYFALIAFGIPLLLWRVSPLRRRRLVHDRLRRWMRSRVDIYTGPIGAKQAALQVLLIPCAAVVIFTFLAVFDVIDHAVH